MLIPPELPLPPTCRQGHLPPGNCPPSQELFMSTPWVAPFLPLATPPFGQDGRRGKDEKKGNLRSMKGAGHSHSLGHQLWTPSSLEESLFLFYPLNKTFCSCLGFSAPGNRDPVLIFKPVSPSCLASLPSWHMALHTP